MQGSEGLLCRYEVSCCASVTEFDRTAGFQVFLERDRTMKMGIGDEQDVGAGWRYGRKRDEGGFSASGCLSALREDRKARCFRRVVPCVASSAAEHAGRHSLEVRAQISYQN